jgi:hypothetical protein
MDRSNIKKELPAGGGAIFSVPHSAFISSLRLPFHLWDYLKACKPMEEI